MVRKGRLQRADRGEKMRQASVSLRPGTLKVLDGLVKKEGLSRSAILARLIDKGLAAESQEEAA